MSLLSSLFSAASGLGDTMDVAGDNLATVNTIGYTAGSGGRGNIASHALEQSNIDMAQEFVNMIATQRGFQANSRIVRAADEMLTELVNIKR